MHLIDHLFQDSVFSQYLFSIFAFHLLLMRGLWGFFLFFSLFLPSSFLSLLTFLDPSLSAYWFWQLPLRPPGLRQSRIRFYKAVILDISRFSPCTSRSLISSWVPCSHPVFPQAFRLLREVWATQVAICHLRRLKFNFQSAKLHKI